MAKEKPKAAPMAARAPAGAPKFFVMQQGREWYVEESASVPDTATERGERMIKVHSSHHTRAEAEARVSDLAEHFQGEVRA